MAEQARERMIELGFTDSEMDFIFADWNEGESHYQWLMTATREEIQSWIDASE